MPRKIVAARAFIIGGVASAFKPVIVERPFSTPSLRVTEQSLPGGPFIGIQLVLTVR